MPPERSAPRQFLALTSVLVREYNEAIAFYVDVLGFSLVEDSAVPAQSKRWVVVAPPGASESRLLLARAASPDQESRIGNQTGGREHLRSGEARSTRRGSRIWCLWRESFPKSLFFKAVLGS